VQFCALLQVPIRLHGDSRNLNRFTATLHLQKCVKCPCTVTKGFSQCLFGWSHAFRRFRSMPLRLEPQFPKVSLNASSAGDTLSKGNQKILFISQFLRIQQPLLRKVTDLLRGRDQQFEKMFYNLRSWNNVIE
jgi:hypothetical protein